MLRQREKYFASTSGGNSARGKGKGGDATGKGGEQRDAGSLEQRAAAGERWAKKQKRLQLKRARRAEQRRQRREEGESASTAVVAIAPADGAAVAASTAPAPASENPLSLAEAKVVLKKLAAMQAGGWSIPGLAVPDSEVVVLEPPVRADSQPTPPQELTLQVAQSDFDAAHKELEEAREKLERQQKARERIKETLGKKDKQIGETQQAIEQINDRAKVSAQKLRECHELAASRIVPATPLFQKERADAAPAAPIHATKDGRNVDEVFEGVYAFVERHMAPSQEETPNEILSEAVEKLNAAMREARNAYNQHVAEEDRKLEERRKADREHAAIEEANLRNATGATDCGGSGGRRTRSRSAERERAEKERKAAAAGGPGDGKGAAARV